MANGVGRTTGGGAEAYMSKVGSRCTPDFVFSISPQASAMRSNFLGSPDEHDVITTVASEARVHMRHHMSTPGLQSRWAIYSITLKDGEEFSVGTPELKLKWPWINNASNAPPQRRMYWERVLSQVYFEAMASLEDMLSNTTPRLFYREVQRIYAEPMNIDAPDVHHATNRTSAQEVTTLELGTRIGGQPAIYLKQGLEGTKYMSTAGLEVDTNDVLATTRVWSRRPPFSLDDQASSRDTEQMWNHHVLCAARVALRAYRLDSVLEPVVTTMSMTPSSGQDWDIDNEDLTIYPMPPPSL